MKNPLASKLGIAATCAYLGILGAICPKCGHGTRATSKKWATCKQCGQRVQRHEIPKAKRSTDEGRRG